VQHDLTLLQLSMHLFLGHRSMVGNAMLCVPYAVSFEVLFFISGIHADEHKHRLQTIRAQSFEEVFSSLPNEK